MSTELSKPNESGFLISASDIDIPRINVVQKTSSIDAPVGAIVLGKEFTLSEADEAIRAAVINPTKGWKEDIPYGTDTMARMVNTEAEAEELRKDSEFKIIEFAELTFLFRSNQEEPDPAAFPLPLGDDFCALGKIHVHKDAYRQTYKVLATWAAGNPDKSVSSVEWDFKSSLIQRGPHSWYAPSLKPTAEPVKEDIAKFIQTISS
jgi:glutathione peroxidase-family protein